MSHWFPLQCKGAHSSNNERCARPALPFISFIIKKNRVWWCQADRKSATHMCVWGGVWVGVCARVSVSVCVELPNQQPNHEWNRHHQQVAGGIIIDLVVRDGVVTFGIRIRMNSNIVFGCINLPLACVDFDCLWSSWIHFYCWIFPLLLYASPWSRTLVVSEPGFRYADPGSNLDDSRRADHPAVNPLFRDGR